MGGILYVISGVGTVVAAWAGGLLTYYVRFRAQIQAIERDKAAVERERAEMRRADAKEFWDAFDKRIGLLKGRLAGAKDDEREAIQSRMCGVQDECERTLKAWLQTQELAALVPPATVTADAPKRTEEEGAELRELLEAGRKLPPKLLTADDYLTRGNAYLEAGDYEQALEAYNRALELAPDNAVTLYNRGIALGDLGRCEDAVKDYDRALELRSDQPETLCNRGAALFELERYENALKDFNRALELKPHFPIALNNRGNALAKLERYEEALRDYNRALELRPDYAMALGNRGITLLKMRRYDDALKDFSRPLELRPDNALALYDRACAYSLMGNFEKALQDLEAAIGGDEKYRETARTDEDFENLRNDPTYGPRFWEIVGREDNAEG